ncbi:MAG: helix-turn-helix transcriptional regulator [Parasporobacterium sp.]|nr:helix-turn-helix transcriptional regulator [Parasporobacterium sp.]
MADILKEARTQSSYYPKFLQTRAVLSDALSPAELRVLRMVCADKSNQEIADLLGLKLPTVKTQVSSIFQKLNVKRRSEAKTAAKELRLSD